MAENNQIITFGKGLVDAAKSCEIQSDKYINLDTAQTALRYKKMAPAVIAARFKVMLEECNDDGEKTKLRAYIAELETAQKYGITQGKSTMIHVASVQSNNKIHACLGIYNLYSLNGKTVCDLIMIDITQTRRVDTETIALSCGIPLALGCFFVGFVGLATGSLSMLFLAAEVVARIKSMTTQERTDIFMLKTLEHYGLVRLIGNDQLELILN